MESTRFTLKLRDWLKGLVMAVGTPVLYLVQELIPNWPLTPIEKAALSATATYLIKNFFTDDLKVAEKVLDEAEAKQAAKFENAAAPNDKELNR